MPIPTTLRGLLRRWGFGDPQVNDFRSIYENLPKPIQLLCNGAIVALAHTGQLSAPDPNEGSPITKILMGVTSDLALWKSFHGIEKTLLYYSASISYVLRKKSNGMDSVAKIGERVADRFKTVRKSHGGQKTFTEFVDDLVDNAYRPLLRGLAVDYDSDNKAAKEIVGRLTRLKYVKYRDWQADQQSLISLIRMRAESTKELLESEDQKERWGSCACAFVAKHKTATEKALDFSSAILMARAILPLPNIPPSMTLEDEERPDFADYVEEKTSEDSCRGLVTSANDLLFSWIEILSVKP